MPSHSAFDLKQMALRQAYRSCATAFYDDNYQPFGNVTEKLTYRSVASGLPDVPCDKSNQVIDWLLSKDISEYAEYDSGSSGGTAKIVAARSRTGKNAILRIDGSSGDHQRIDHPAVTQPLRDEQECPIVLDLGQNRNIAALPFVRMVGLTKGAEFGVDPYVQSMFLALIFTKAGLICPGGIKDDMAVLPDGSINGVDPDVLKFKDKPLSMDENAARIREIGFFYPHLSPILWMKGNKSKQEIFFPPGYLSTPLPPKQEATPQFGAEGPPVT